MKKYKEIVIIVMLIICALYGHCENNKYIYQFQDVDSMYLKIITQPIFVTSGITRLNFDIYWQESGRKGNVFKSKSEINNLTIYYNHSMLNSTLSIHLNTEFKSNINIVILPHKFSIYLGRKLDVNQTAYDEYIDMLACKNVAFTQNTLQTEVNKLYLYGNSISNVNTLRFIKY